ncbi:unnamed protein product [Vitrella brassicaformis CCMP3155]|uniref:Uncharacterized protein n=2 Tax=Vitrella brassicaformis TaxID=1169539 RepID=A0A0G4EWE2_VITBC|nr:unnamed protein product [Vitrella brassicaformis CCMP3155]|mmetsp:Transcript_5050/g.11812  ORF Transcript_5050/g.11812 Transcript_5050/m.11812 type:complete len:337 (+) Transcript_5050:103-1113(+)|eukprot:CEM02773.1 unnamed protein product [Vitrella brassicaformis CCMP3155]
MPLPHACIPACDLYGGKDAPAVSDRCTLFVQHHRDDASVCRSRTTSDASTTCSSHSHVSRELSDVPSSPDAGDSVSYFTPLNSPPADTPVRWRTPQTTPHPALDHGQSVDVGCGLRCHADDRDSLTADPSEFSAEVTLALSFVCRQANISAKSSRCSCIAHLLDRLVRRGGGDGLLPSIVAICFCLNERLSPSHHASDTITSSSSSHPSPSPSPPLAHAPSSATEKRFSLEYARNDEDFLWRFLPLCWLAYAMLVDETSVSTISIDEFLSPLYRCDRFALRYPIRSQLIGQFNRQTMALWSSLGFRVLVQRDEWAAKISQLGGGRVTVEVEVDPNA